MTLVRFPGMKCFAEEGKVSVSIITFFFWRFASGLLSKSECINFWSVESSVYELLSTDNWACIFSMDFWVKLEVSFRLFVTIGVWISVGTVGTVGDISAVALTDQVSVVFFGANCWEEQRVLMSVSLNEGAGCWRELLDLLLSL